MATGRRDYTWGFLNEAAVEGRYTQSFIVHTPLVLAANTLADIYLYTVPAGYRLAINLIGISTNSRVVNTLHVLVATVSKTVSYFSDNYNLLFSDQNPLYITAGQILNIKVKNSDEATYTFYVHVVGALEQLT